VVNRYVAGLIAGLVIGAGHVPMARAHGEPEKVVDGRMSVSLALAPAEQGTRLRFLFSDIRTWRLLDTPLTLSLTVRDPRTGAGGVVQSGVRVRGGVLDTTHTFAGPGPWEVLVEFERDDDTPRRTYRPEDWLVVPPGSEPVSWGGVAGLAGVLGALTVGLLYVSRRDRAMIESEMRSTVR
jgi:hypothetical protein